MLFWSALLFVLGILAFLDSIFNYGEIFRQINSVVFLLISLAITVRTATKMKEARMEEYSRKIIELEHKIGSLERKPKEKSLY